MRILSALDKDKKAVSLIVSYVILITITLSLSVLVYNWLRFYVSGDEIPECSSNVNIIIQDYYCVRSYVNPETGMEPGNLQITLKNKGLFNISGFALRVHDREGAESGFYTLDYEGAKMVPGEEYNKTYYFDKVLDDEYIDYNLETVTIVEVQPFIMEKGKVVCKSYASQKINC